MANSKISNLSTATTPLAGTEVLPVVQSGSTKQVSVANLTAGRAVQAASIGINMTPAYVLDVTDNSTGQQARLSSSSSGGVSMGFVSTSTNGRTWRIGGNYVIGNGEWSLYDSTANKEVLRADSSQNVTVVQGNFIPGTAAKGINFTANTPAAGMTSQLLNWYEEGTFTPTFDGTGGVTYSAQLGWYTRIGNLVTVTVLITTSALTRNANDVTVGSLPWSLSSSGGYFPPGSVFPEIGFNSANATEGYYCIGIQGTATLKIYGVKSSTGTNVTNVSYNDLQTGTNRVRVTLTYRV